MAGRRGEGTIMLGFAEGGGCVLVIWRGRKVRGEGLTHFDPFFSFY